jgi:predicted transcriptional regulator of viral defense system
MRSAIKLRRVVTCKQLTTYGKFSRVKSNRHQKTAAMKSGAILRVRSAPMHRVGIRKLAREGSLVQLGRGIYRVADAPLESHEDLALVAARKEDAVICLLSALRFHELTTESPGSVWIAVENHSRPPRIESLKLKVHYFSGASYREGIETHVIAGVPVKIYSVEKTLADCFKFRNQIGAAVAVEALKDAWKKRKAKTEGIYHFARVCRVLNVMRPYLEGILE